MVLTKVWTGVKIYSITVRGLVVMGEEKLTKAMQFISLYSSFKSEELDDFFSRNEREYYDNGETKTLYSGMSLANIVVRLMDNRNFNQMTDEVKREMIYTEYYPEEARGDFNVYMDDRWNLCQELHNKLCGELSITPTKLKFINFKESDIDHDCFVHYNPFDGVIYLNNLIEYHNCETTELAERVCQATFIHQLHMELKHNFYTIDKVDKKKRYMLLSTFNKMFAFTSLSQEKAGSVRRNMEFNDGYSAGMVYAIFATYEYLNKIFTCYKLTNHPMLGSFNDSRICYLESLIGNNKEEEVEVEYYYEDEDDETEVVEGILYDTIGYDLDILHTIDTSVLNEDSKSFVFKVLLNEMDKCAGEFYKYFGNGLQVALKDQYQDYIDAINDEMEEDEDELTE